MRPCLSIPNEGRAYLQPWMVLRTYRYFYEFPWGHMVDNSLCPRLILTLLALTRILGIGKIEINIVGFYTVH